MSFKVNVYSLNLGIDEFNKTNYKQAIKFFNDSIIENPLLNCIEAIKLRGISNFKLENYNEAIKDFTEYIEIDEEYIIYKYRAKTYKILNKKQEAIRDLKKAISIQPNEDFLHYELCHLLFENREYEDALIEVNKLCSYDKSKEVLLLKGKILEQLGKNFPAIICYSQIISSNPDDFEAKFATALVLFKEKDYTLAKVYFNACLHIKITKTLFYYRGMCKKELNDFEGYTKDIIFAKNNGVLEAINEVNSNPNYFNDYYLFFDTETTGLPKNWNLPITNLDNWPRLVQLAWILYDKNGVFVEKKSVIIKPKDFTIPTSSSEIHKITNEKANNEGIDIDIVLSEFKEKLSYSKTLIAHNMNFDKKIIGAEFLRAFNENPLSNKNKICTMELSTNICKISGEYGYKWPKLQELHQFLFGEEFEEAHDASIDIQATAKCYWEMKKRNLI